MSQPVDKDRNQKHIYMETVSAPTNIACIKYWGKANIALNTPINDSVSVTLDQSNLCAITTASASFSFTQDRLWLNGVEDPNAHLSKRFRACIDGIKKLASDREVYIESNTNDTSDDDNNNNNKRQKVLITKQDWQSMHVHISSYNTFPTAAGLASSAAGYAALVYSLVQLYNAKETYPGEFTTIARMGSGSACRSLYGGFVAWRKGTNNNDDDDGSDSIAEQIANENHWPEIRALIMVVSDLKKDTSSTSGMTTSVNTSKLLSYRASHIVDSRMKEISNAWLTKDFPTFAKITMMDSNQFHATCLDTYPPIFYMNDVSKSIIRVVHAYNDWAGEVRVAYTFDAGPNAVLYTLEKYVVEICALMNTLYPQPNQQNNKEGEEEQRLEEYIMDPDLVAKVKEYSFQDGMMDAVTKSSGRVVKRNEVKKIYYTKSGPGPQLLPKEKSLIDAVTGLNTYSPISK